jgi:hypothetical protein
MKGRSLSSPGSRQFLSRLHDQLGGHRLGPAGTGCLPRLLGELAPNVADTPLRRTARKSASVPPLASTRSTTSRAMLPMQSLYSA